MMVEPGYGPFVRLSRVRHGAVLLVSRPATTRPPMNDERAVAEPWQWSDGEWRAIVDRVRAGRAYRPARWKDGARCAVALSFDSDHETNELRDGGHSIGRLSLGPVRQPRRRAAHPRRARAVRRARDVLRPRRRGAAPP